MPLVCDERMLFYDPSIVGVDPHIAIGILAKMLDKSRCNIERKHASQVLILEIIAKFLQGLSKIEYTMQAVKPTGDAYHLRARLERH